MFSNNAAVVAALAVALQQQRSSSGCGGGGGNRSGSNRVQLAKSSRRGGEGNENEDSGADSAARINNSLKQSQLRIEQQKEREKPCFVSKIKFRLLATDEDEGLCQLLQFLPPRDPLFIYFFSASFFTFRDSLMF